MMERIFFPFGDWNGSPVSHCHYLSSMLFFFFFSSSYMLSNIMANYGMKKLNVCFVVIIASA